MLRSIFRRRKKRIIIAIHGLDNKPCKKILKKWWQKSIIEGLSLHEHEVNKFEFEMVYWAHVLYEQPLDPTINEEEHPLYLDEPYVPMVTEKKVRRKSRLKRLFDKFEGVVDGLFLSKNNFINFEYIFNAVIKRSFRDLDTYYNDDLKMDTQLDEPHAREKIRNHLREALQEHKNKEIMLIAHSMGSIIAYDVIYELQSEVDIHTFITIGSPLGLPMIMKKIFEQQKQSFDPTSKLKTPENVHRWYNHADEHDRVAMNSDLAQEFEANNLGIKPIDSAIENDFKHWKTGNAHKSYGYLRTPEIAKIIGSFLNDQPTNILQKIKETLNLADSSTPVE